jgi:hypothetical protein
MIRRKNSLKHIPGQSLITITFLQIERILNDIKKMIGFRSPKCPWLFVCPLFLSCYNQPNNINVLFTRQAKSPASPMSIKFNVKVNGV